jgi:hypothetical protein
MNLSDPTPNEVQAAIIADLEAKLSLASEREFYIMAENARLRAEVEAFKSNNRYHRGHSAGYAEAKDDCAAELAVANKRLADCEFLLEHRYKIIQRQESRCSEAIAKREQAEAERDRAEAEVAELKKVLLEFGQSKGTK